MTRLYARASGRGRIYEGTPDSRWSILTIICAISYRGMIATMTIEEATYGDIFRDYIERALCPALKPGDVVVMDNLSSHKVAGVEQRIEKCGAEVLYLPPYSPDLNPIEKAWSRATKRCSAQPRPEAKKRSTKPSQNSFLRSPRRTQKHGSNTASEVYSNREML